MALMSPQEAKALAELELWVVEPAVLLIALHIGMMT